MPLWVQALFWGLVGGAALLIGAVAAYRWAIPGRIVAIIMAFGAGVLISALSFDLMDEAYHDLNTHGVPAIAFLGGAILYTAADWLVARQSARARERAGQPEPAGDDEDEGGSGLSIAIGSLLDGIPESIVIGVALVDGKVNTATVVAVFLSGIPEGMSASASMKRAGRSTGYVYGMYAGMTIIMGLAALVGYFVFRGFSENVVSATEAVAAGAILAMVTNAMIPESFKTERSLTGLIAVIGFVMSFVISKAGG